MLYVVWVQILGGKKFGVVVGDDSVNFFLIRGKCVVVIPQSKDAIFSATFGGHFVKV